MRKTNHLFNWNNEILAGLSGGLLMAASFPPFPTRVLSLVALVPLIRYFLVVFPEYAEQKKSLKRGFWTGYVFGLAFFSVLLFWIAKLIPESPINMSWILVPAVVLFILYLSCFTGLFTLALAWLVKRFGNKAIFMAPAIWALIELVRSSGELAFSWGLISSSLVPYPLALQGLSLYGPFGLSMVIVFLNVLVGFIIFSTKTTQRFIALAFLIIVISAHIVYGNFRIAGVDRYLAESPSGKKVAIVQPNVNMGDKWKPEFCDSVFVQVESLASKASALGADLVIFPETAAPVSISHSAKYRNWLKKISKASGVDLLIGYINHVKENGNWRSFNACGMFDNRGVLKAEYEKIRLLPFGEKVPLSQYIPALEKIDFGQANFKPGDNMTIFDSAAGKFGALICFESTFSDYTRSYIKNGAQFLVNITNDGWFGSPRGALQHAESTVLRAVENGVFLVRSANTGISMSIDPAGRVVESVGFDRESIILTPVKIARKMTFYCRHGQLSFILMFAGNLLIILLPAFFQRH